MRAVQMLTLAAVTIAATGCAQAVQISTPGLAPGDAPVVFRGTVSDLTSFAPLQSAGVELALLGSATKPFATTVTDEHGDFSIPGLTPGKYMLHIARPGYAEIRMRVDAKPTADKPLDIRMRALSDRLCTPSRYHTLECP